MIYLFYTIHVLNCLFLVLVVLLQQGKGADLSVFGGGGTMTAFGARGAATLLHKMTVFGFVGFIVTTLVIGVLQKQGGGSSVMTDMPAVEATAESEEAEATEEPVGALPEADDATVTESEAGAGEAEAGEGVLPEAETFTEGEGEGGGEDAPSENGGEESTP